MSGLPKKYPGVWQSLQPPSVTRYLPRVICESSAMAANAGSAITDAVMNAKRTEIHAMICLPASIGWSPSAVIVQGAYSTQLCALWFAADHGAVRGGCVEPDRLDVPEAGLLEPRRIFGRRVVSSFRLDQHVEAHQRSRRRPGLFVIDEKLADDDCAAARQSLEGPAQQAAVLRLIPIVQDHRQQMHVVIPGKLLEEVAAGGLDAVGQAGLGNFSRGDRGHMRQIKYGRAQLPILFAKLDVVRARSAADVQKAAEMTEIHGFAELARGHRRERMHRLPEERQHRRILAVEHRGLHCRVPRG